MMNGVLLKLSLTVQLIKNRLSLIQNRFELQIIDMPHIVVFWTDLKILFQKPVHPSRLITTSLMFHAFNNFALEVVQCRAYFTRKSKFVETITKMR